MPRYLRNPAVCAAVVAVMASGCTAADVRTDTTEPAATTSTRSPTSTSVPVGPRMVEATLEVGADGSTEPLEFVVPPDTRSIGVTASAGASAVIGVAELTLADGSDRVGIESIPQVLLESIADQHLRLLPGDVLQEASVGVHAFVYPNTPHEEAALPAGDATLRLVSTGRAMDVVIVLPPVVDDLSLPVDVFVTDPTIELSESSPALATASDLFAQAGIEILWKTVTSLAVEEPTVSVESAVTVDGPMSEVVDAAAGVGTEAIDVFVVSDLPVSGLSPRIPGPTTQSPLRAVLVESTQRPSDLGRVIAHELAHYLGLHHLELHTDDNRPVSDPIDDTEPGTNNLMAGGTLLTAGQVDVLRRSPLLEPTR